MSDQQKNQDSLKGGELFNLSLEQLDICLQEKIDLNTLFLLEMFNKGVDMSKYLQNTKIEGWKQTLIRKSFIDTNGKILNQGKLVLDNIHKLISRQQKEKLAPNITNEETSFDIWWKSYPNTDIFETRGKTFKGTRKFKVEKDTCRQLFNRVLNTNEYTAEELIESIKLERETRIEESYRTGQNKLTYLQNTATYLRQYSFDAYVELVRKGMKTQETKQDTDYSGGIYI